MTRSKKEQAKVDKSFKELQGVIGKLLITYEEDELKKIFMKKELQDGK